LARHESPCGEFEALVEVAITHIPDGARSQPSPKKRLITKGVSMKQQNRDPILGKDGDA